MAAREGRGIASRMAASHGVSMSPSLTVLSLVEVRKPRVRVAFLVAQRGQCLPCRPSSCTGRQARRGKPGGRTLVTVQRRKPRGARRVPYLFKGCCACQARIAACTAQLEGGPGSVETSLTLLVCSHMSQ